MFTVLSWVLGGKIRFLASSFTTSAPDTSCPNFVEIVCVHQIHIELIQPIHAEWISGRLVWIFKRPLALSRINREGGGEGSSKRPITLFFGNCCAFFLVSLFLAFVLSARLLCATFSLPFFRSSFRLSLSLQNTCPTLLWRWGLPKMIVWAS